MTSKLNTRFNRAKDIYQQEGFVILLKKILTFLLSRLSYKKYIFYVSEVVIERWNEADFMPKLPDITFKIVETNQQLDELLNYGFDLSLLNIIEARQRLERGAILSLIFIERELAYTGWMAMTEEAKNTFNHYPYKVDFSNNEACVGDAWVNPKYRRYGLNTYAIYRRREYLMGKGIKKIRLITLINNIAMLKLQEKLQGEGIDRIYTKALYIRIFGLQFWKEKPVESTSNRVID